MSEMGFEVLVTKFVAGHECDDVEHIFDTTDITWVPNAPSEEAKKALPDDIVYPSQAVLDKTILLFHDKSTFQWNDDQSTFWGTKGPHVTRPKSKGAGIMREMDILP